MKLCPKHQLFIETKLSNVDQINVLSEFNEKLDVASYQDKIEYRRNQCQICYFGAIGKNILDKIIKNMNKSKPMIA